MSDRQELTNEIRKTYGNALNIQQVTLVLGFKDRRAAKNFMTGIPPIDMGKEKKWLASDVSRRICDRREVTA